MYVCICVCVRVCVCVCMYVCMYVCIFVCMYVSPYGTTRLHLDGFHGIRHYNIFRKSIDKIQLARITGTLGEDQYKFMIIYRSVLLRLKNFPDKRSRDDQNANFKFRYCFFRKSCCLWDKLEKNIVKPDRPQMTLWRMRIAWCVSKATNTHSEYVLRNCFSTATMAVRTRFNVTLYSLNSSWGKIFRTHTDRPRGPPSLLCNRYRVCLGDVQLLRCGADHPPHLKPGSSIFRAITLVFPLCLHGI